MGYCEVRNRVDVEGDMETLARWRSVMEGRAASLERVPSAATAGGRPDFIDARSHDVRRALRARERLRTLGLARDGTLHAAVLEFVYVTSGVEWRRRVDPLGDGRGVAEQVGLRFAPPEVVAGWSAMPRRGLRRTLPTRFGRELLDAAIDAYVALVRAEIDVARGAPTEVPA